MKFYINGWREGRSYFFSIGQFTEDEIEMLMSGEIVTKNGNEFYIEIIEA